MLGIYTLKEGGRQASLLHEKSPIEWLPFNAFRHKRESNKKNFEYFKFRLDIGFFFFDIILPYI